MGSPHRPDLSVLGSRPGLGKPRERLAAGHRGDPQAGPFWASFNPRVQRVWYRCVFS